LFTRVLSRSAAKEHLGETAILNFVHGELNPLRLQRRGKEKTSIYTGKLTSTDDANPPDLKPLEGLALGFETMT
jgi:hypothetical protein